MKHTITPLLLFVIFPFTPPHAQARFSQALSVDASLTAGRASGYRTKLQPGLSFGLVNQLALGHDFALNLSLGYHSVAPSDLRFGYGLRGYDGVHVGVGPEYSWLVFEGDRDHAASQLRFGVRGEFAASYSIYHHTDILFFHFSAGLWPFLNLRPASPLFFRIETPLLFHFRRDLEFSLTPSTRLWIGFDYGFRRGAEKEPSP